MKFHGLAKTFFAHGSGKGLTKCDVTAWKEGEGTVFVRIKNQGS